MFKSLIFQWGATLYVSAVSLAIGIFLARSLGPVSYGTYSMVVAIGAILLIFIDGGFRTLLLRENIRPSLGFEHMQKSLPMQAFGHALMAALFFAFVSLFLFSKHLKLALVTILCFFCIALTQFISAKLRGSGRFILEAGWQVGHRSLSAIFIAIVLLLGFHEPWHVLLSWTIAILVCCAAVSFSSFYRPKFEFNSSIYRASLALLWIDLATAIYFRSDIVVMKFLNLDELRIGQYAAAYRILEFFILFMNPLALLIFRKIRQAEIVRQISHKLLFQSILYSALLGIFFALILTLFGTFVIEFAYGGEYLGAVTFLALLAWSLVFIIPNAVVSQFALAMNLDRRYALSATVAAVFNVISNLLLINFFGIIVAAYVTVFTEALLLILLVIFVLLEIQDRKL